MHRFHYKNNELYCEHVKVAAVAKAVGTPFYLYSYQTLVYHYQQIEEAFAPVNPLICFAMKSNGNLAVVRTLINQGAGVDIVSGGELQKALKAGADPQKICFTSVGKTDEEITLAIKKRILLFNVESLAELSNLNAIAKRLGKKPQVALRLNPDVDAVTHKSITTGTLKNKFGIDLSTATNIFRSKKRFPNLNINGVHIHIGSQITQSAPYIKAIRKILKFIAVLRSEGIAVEYLDIGGGMAVDYKKGAAQTAQQFANDVLPLLKKAHIKIIIEPGRFITGSAGIFVTKMLYLKDNGFKKFIIVDGGMNDLLRPALYDAYHEIVPVKKKPGREIKVDVVGPICESGDFFAHDYKIPEVKRGELLAIMTAGAYGYTMSSNYNIRPRVAEVMVKANSFSIVKQRETLKDLMRGESLPKFVK
ncbi:MAG: diaminopimelate decarboxylase [Candidatus Aceula meridiana]|nr:diaminopimelate decarboxylase [Candidatus Aceula meridiana]